MNIREDAAQFYDFQNIPISDIPFYRARIPSPQARILELGCGTGRVLLPLAQECGSIYGMDASPSMLAICREKLNRAGLPTTKARVSQGDISDFDLGERFDLIIAPFRVLQNLETDAQVTGLMRGIARHLTSDGKAILNTFLPNSPPEEILRGWCSADEQIDGETSLPNGDRLVRSHRRPHLVSSPLILYPELIYRRYTPESTLEEEAILKIAMRCWYPAELEKLIRDSGFRMTDRWGGYQGEPWGEGPELVIEFAKASPPAA